MPRGAIAFHDVEVWSGVTRFYRELLASSRGWKEVCQVRSLRIVQRLE